MLIKLRFTLIFTLMVLQSFASSSSLTHEINKSDKEKFDSAWHLTILSNDYVYLNDTTQTEYYFKQLVDFSAKVNLKSVDWCVLYALAIMNMELYQQPMLAHVFADSAVNIAFALDDEVLMFRSYLMKANFYQSINDNGSTYEYINKINDLIVNKRISLKNTNFYDYFNKLGGVYYREQAYEQALIYFQYALLGLFKILNNNEEDYYSIQNILDNIALTFENLGKLDKAEQYFKMAIFYSYKTKNPERPLGVNYGNLASLYHQKKMYKEALYLYNKALNYSLDFSNREISHGVKTLMKLTELYIQMGEMKNAYQAIERAAHLIQSYHLNHLQQQLHYVMAKYYHQNGEFDVASHLLVGFIKYQDFINNITYKNETLKRIYSTNIRRNALINKRLKAELELETVHRNFYGFALLVVVLAVVFLFVSFYKNKRENAKLQKLNAELEDKSNQLIKKNELLDSLNTQKSYLINTVAHDLRNPVGSVSSLVELIDTNNLTTDDKELMDMIKISAINAMNIMEDILDNASIERGTIALNKKVSKIGDIIINASEILKYRTVSKNISIKLDLDQRIVSNVDAVRLGRVVMNLLTNAIKFSNSGSVVEVKLVNNLNHTFTLSVIDTGIGISKDKLEKIFEPFSGNSKPGTSNEKSVGLGLSIAKKIVALHNGNITVESTEGVGSNFMVTMPIQV